MKKIYFLLVFCLGFAANAQIVTIPDANFRTYLLSTVDTNFDGNIQVSEASALHFINVDYSNIYDLTGVEHFPNLWGLSCVGNHISSIDVSGLTQLHTIECGFNQITTINLDGVTNLQNLYCSNNDITSLDFSDCPNLHYVECISNNLTSLDVSGKTNLTNLRCNFNLLTSLNANGATNLIELSCLNNQISNLQINGLPNLETLQIYNNHLTSLDLTNFENLKSLQLGGLNSPMTSIDLSYLTNLEGLYVNASHFTTLDLSALSKLTILHVYNNQDLETLFMKNGKIQTSMILSNNNILHYVCADEGEITAVQSSLAGYNCNINSYCTFVPGGTFYSINGEAIYDINSDGCSNDELNYPYLKLIFNNGTTIGNMISSRTGFYRYDVQSGTHTIIPVLENPSYFTITPSTTSVTFPAASSPYNQNFCLTPNGVHNDLEVFVLPLNSARPGFDAMYKIFCRNKGTHPQSGNLIFNFNDALMDFSFSNPIISNQGMNTLSWNFTDLQPFEIREIIVVLSLNSPMDTPAINAGDVLNYTVSINGLTDEYPDDNVMTLNQIVVNSYDPNDKTCIEGTTISLDKVGKYVHYIIRFENNGTANAQNIVVKDIIDTTKFDISTLRPIDSSHSMTTQITNTNKVEFIFENIQLPFDDANNDGYVAFKIKTKPTLVAGNSFSNTASIYFDYNFPIITNTATTTIQALSNPDFEFSNYFELAPNPAKDILNIQTKNDIELSSVSIYNAFGQLVIVVPNANETTNIDVSQLTSGTYFVKVFSDKGSSSSKFIKQ